MRGALSFVAHEGRKNFSGFLGGFSLNLARLFHPEEPRSTTLRLRDDRGRDKASKANTPNNTNPRAPYQ
eukprot:2352670-Prymnesium_polylepis.1